MKHLTFSLSVLVTSVICMSFLPDPITPAELVGTKWISPITDNCSESLCFTSENTLYFYRCEAIEYFEIGYTINGNNIEIGAYPDSTRNPATKLILYLDNGILRQHPNSNNYFPKNYIKIAFSGCSQD